MHADCHDWTIRIPAASFTGTGAGPYVGAVDLRTLDEPLPWLPKVPVDIVAISGDDIERGFIRAGSTDGGPKLGGHLRIPLDDVLIPVPTPRSHLHLTYYGSGLSGAVDVYLTFRGPRAAQPGACP